MATYEDSNDDWWESVPCHFIWGLEKKVTVHFRSVKTNLDSKLETRKDVNWSDSACDLLLFRGFLEVSDFDGIQRDFWKAEQFFQEADKEAMNTKDELERNAYVTVATANRLWALRKKTTGLDEDTADEQVSLLKVLEDSWKKYQDGSESREKINAYIDTVAAFAMSRLGVLKYKEAERRYRHAMKVLGQSVKSSWCQSLGMLIGRQSKHTAGPAPQYSEIENEVRFYRKALRIDAYNESARCDLALALGRIPDRVKEANRIIQQVDETYCEIFVKKARFFRRQGEYEKCLDVLREGEGLASLTMNFYHQFAAVYKVLTKIARRKRDSQMEREYSEKVGHYLDICLKIDPMNFGALSDKAFLYSMRGQFYDAEKLHLHIIEEFKSSPFNLLGAQYFYAEFILCWNQYRMNEASASAFEDVLRTACSILSKMGSLGDDTTENKYVLDSKKRLEQYYKTFGEGQKLRDLQNRTSSVGF